MSHTKAYKGRPTWRKQVDGDHRLTPGNRQILSTLTRPRFINWTTRIGCFTDLALAKTAGTNETQAARALAAGVKLGHLRAKNRQNRSMILLVFLPDNSAPDG